MDEERIMNLDEILAKSIDRKYRINNKKDGILYHYTTLDGLFSIIKNGTFWVTGSEFLNDTSELKYIKEVVEEVTYYIEENDDDYPFKQALISRLNGVYFNTKHRSNCYVLSLTDQSDLITLWSSYSKFEGYSLGLDAFDLHQIIDYRYGMGYISGYVIYDKNEQESIINEEFEKYLSIWKSIPDCSLSDLSKIIDKFMFRILIYSYFFKHPSFKQEEEYRIAFFPESFPEQSKFDVQFRPSNGVIILS
jgi:hypothetical protein